MISLIRVAAAVNKVVPADSDGCLKNLWECVDCLKEDNPDIIVFPTLSLSGRGCGSLFRSAVLLEGCRKALENLCILSRELESYLVVGLPLEDGGRPVSVTAVLHSGEVRGLIPSFDAPPEMDFSQFSHRILPVDTVFRCGNLSFSVLPGDVSKLSRRMHLLEGTGCDLVLVPSYEPASCGSMALGRDVARQVSRDHGVAVAVANGGAGDSSSPYLYRGWCGVWECGTELCGEQCQGDSAFCLCDVDSDIIHSQKASKAYRDPVFSAYGGLKRGLLRRVARNPFLTGRDSGAMMELFDLQVRSLADRLTSTGMTRLVLGVSGGLDSTLAALVCAKALALCNLPPECLIGVTMPGFGTTERTKGNGAALLEGLGARILEIPIGDACRQHFQDIGLHDEDRGAAYENAQARERTQILMDIGNMENALVVGTGDLSEAALGWCTYGGDHLAGYNVNICLTKGMVRKLCSVLAANGVFPQLTGILRDIINTPISPELLPPDENGEMVQRSEDILGPYELHDFFLYYLIRYSMRPSKIYHYACIAFSGSYKPEYLKDRLAFFLRRFCSSQFKRSVETSSAAIDWPNLCGVGFTMPSDLRADALLRELDSGE